MREQSAEGALPSVLGCPVHQRNHEFLQLLSGPCLFQPRNHRQNVLRPQHRRIERLQLDEKIPMPRNVSNQRLRRRRERVADVRGRVSVETCHELMDSHGSRCFRDAASRSGDGESWQTMGDSASMRVAEDAIKAGCTTVFALEAACQGWNTSALCHATNRGLGASDELTGGRIGFPRNPRSRLVDGLLPCTLLDIRIRNPRGFVSRPSRPWIKSVLRDLCE